MDFLIGLAIGIAVGAAIPDTIRAVWKRIHTKTRTALDLDDKK